MYAVGFSRRIAHARLRGKMQYRLGFGVFAFWQIGGVCVIELVERDAELLQAVAQAAPVVR
jgi:hypothetical protein